MADATPHTTNRKFAPAETANRSGGGTWADRYEARTRDARALPASLAGPARLDRTLESLSDPAAPSDDLSTRQTGDRPTRPEERPESAGPLVATQPMGSGAVFKTLADLSDRAAPIRSQLQRPRHSGGLPFCLERLFQLVRRNRP